MLPSASGRACRTELATSSEITTRASSMVSSDAADVDHPATSAAGGPPRPTTGVKGRRIVIGARTELLDTRHPHQVSTSVDRPECARCAGAPNTRGPGGVGLSAPGRYADGPSKWSRAIRRVVGDHRLDAERRRTGRGPSGVFTVHTWIRRSRLRSRRPSRGFSRSRSMPGPAIQPGPSTLVAICQEYCRSMSSTTSRSGASFLTRVSATGEKLITRAGESGAGPADRVEQVDQPPLDQPGVPGRVLGLDGQVDRPVVVADRLQEPAQGQHPPGLLVDLGRLVVEVGPGVLPGREVELVELRRAPSWRPPRARCVTRSTRRSWTQTRCPSAVSRTSHSRPSAPSSRAAT